MTKFVLACSWDIFGSQCPFASWKHPLLIICLKQVWHMQNVLGKDRQSPDVGLLFFCQSVPKKQFLGWIAFYVSFWEGLRLGWPAARSKGLYKKMDLRYF